MIFPQIVGLRLVSAEPERLIDFYRALGFAIGEARAIPSEEMAVLGLAGAGRRWPMTVSGLGVEIDAFSEIGRSYPTDSDAAALIFQHFALRTADIQQMWRRALSMGAVPISREGPVSLPASAGGVTAVKFRDPEGHPLEFLQFPDDSDTGCSGVSRIDHTAISVSDLERSRAFYTGCGLEPGAGSLNQGPTQVALDGLDEVKVQVAPLLPARRPPHLELLAYENPRGRGHAPLKANDVAATRVVWRGGRHALLADPDGHLHQICP